MELIRPFERLGKGDAGIAGGKAASLGEMTQAGIPVPPGFVVLAGAFEKFLEEADLNQELDAILDQVNREEVHSVDSASEKIQALIKSAKMPEDIAKEILSNFEKLDAEFVAVRSSATAEDGATAAWAGQLDTFLNTTEDNVLENVQKCWASLFTPRAIFYRFEKGMHGQNISVAVVVQKMVQSEVSGIAFSVHPVTEDYNQMIIEAGFGLGEAIVSGQVTPDSYVIEKVPRRIIDKNITHQNRALVRAGSSKSEHTHIPKYVGMSGEGNVWRQLSEEEGSKPALTDEQVLELAELVLKIEKHYGFPCDIEWAFEAGTFYITQSRPITTLSSKSPENALIVKESDYEFMFEAQDTTTLLQDIVAEHYMPGNSVFLVQNGTVRRYVSKETLKGMGAVGLKRSPKETRAAMAKLTKTVKDGEAKIEKMLQREVGLKDVKQAVDLFKEICSQYAYFDPNYWNGTYEKSFTDDHAKKNIQLLQEYKNEIRKTIGDFFYGDGSMIMLLDKLGGQMHALKADMEWYTQKELIGLFSGELLSAEKLSQRRKLYVLHKDSSSKMHLYEQSEAADFIANFLEKSEVFNDGEIRGTIAHSTGKKVKAKVRIVKRDYARGEGLRTEMAAMQQGEILVTQGTDPEMMPALQKASAVITDVGDMLSHAAITARELNIPCIIATGNASKILKTGDLVEVDAGKGVVRKI